MIAIIAAVHLTLGAAWHSVAPGIWLREEHISTGVDAVVVRIDPRLNRFRLELARSSNGLDAKWVVDSMPAAAAVALNAGQFIGGFPWGWVVRDGIESKPPGTGSLAMAMVIDSVGKVALLTPDEIAAWRGRATHAFQSYPSIIVDGRIRWELQASGRGVDLEHHDSRLAVCTREDGTIMIALTRFAGSSVPWGPTVPEMASYMITLGCVRAMLLDGGISSQLAVRSDDGTVRQWKNWRHVPLGLIITPLRR